MRLGPRQLQLLAQLGTPERAVVVRDRISASLVRQGLLAAETDGSFGHITPVGLRALADALEQGRIEGFSVEKARAKTALQKAPL